MNKKEMVKTVLERGILIAPGMLDKLNEDTLKSIINEAEQNTQTALVVDSIPDSPPPTESPQPTTKPTKTEYVQNTHTEKPKHEPISITIRELEQKNTLSTEDFVGYYNNKHNTIRDMLLRKVNAVSINKTNNHGTVTIIGMVRELTQNGLIIEDATGHAEVFGGRDIIRDMNISEDDVLAITGNMREGKVFLKEITLPDVPLTHPVGELDATISFSERAPKTQDTDVVCTPDSINNNKNTALPNPAWINIKKQGKSIKLLVYKPKKDATLSNAIESLKKRHLSPERSQIRGPDDPFLIDPIPDVFWFITKEKGHKAYKGVTIVSCGQSAVARIALDTRKVEFIDNKQN